MSDPAQDARLDMVAILSEPIRRRLYEYVRQQRREVGRDEAARAVGVARALAVFHLDKLVAAGLLDVSYQRLSGRAGPGAGRPSKLYRASPRELAVSIPQRRYDVAASLLASALASSRGARTERALAGAARARGAALAADTKRAAGSHPSREKLLRAAERVLAAQGYEPRREGAAIRMRNCPFDALAKDHRDLVCGMNLDVMKEFARGLGASGVRASFERSPGYCCVALHVDGAS